MYEYNFDENQYQSYLKQGYDAQTARNKALTGEIRRLERLVLDQKQAIQKNTGVAVTADGTPKLPKIEESLINGLESYIIEYADLPGAESALSFQPSKEYFNKARDSALKKIVDQARTSNDYNKIKLLGENDGKRGNPMNPYITNLAGSSDDQIAKAYTNSYVPSREKRGFGRKRTSKQKGKMNKKTMKKTHRGKKINGRK